MADIQATANKIVENVENVMVGKRQAVQLTVLGLLCQGHILIEDVPGVGKTVLAKSLSKSVGCKFQRIQFTPDMLPSDVTGVYSTSRRGNSSFAPGPFTPRSSWSTRSTGLRQKPSQPCWRPWRSDR